MTTHEALVQLRALRDQIAKDIDEEVWGDTAWGRKTAEALTRAIDALAWDWARSVEDTQCTG